MKHESLATLLHEGMNRDSAETAEALGPQNHFWSESESHIIKA